MGFLDKILKEAGRQIGNKVAGEVAGSIADAFGGSGNTTGSSNAGASQASDSVPVCEWDEIPAEENQYNFSGSYTEYFEKIFREDFGECSVAKEQVRNGNRFIYTLSKAGAKALVVELMSETCAAQGTKKACAAEGVPYLRFYYNHHGWWNTRSYVTQRIRSVIG